MKPFTVYCPRTGAIIRTGSCQDHMVDRQARQGEGVLERDTNPQTDAICLKTLNTIPKPPVAVKPVSYQLQRFQGYPSPGDQLDVIWRLVMFWQESHSLPLTHEAEDMINRIQAVKREFPKS